MILHPARNRLVASGERVVERGENWKHRVTVADPKANFPRTGSHTFELHVDELVLRGAKRPRPREAAVLTGSDGVAHWSLEARVLDHEGPEPTWTSNVGNATPGATQNLPHGAAVGPRVVGADPFKDGVLHVRLHTLICMLLSVLPVQAVKIIDSVPTQKLDVSEPVLPREDVPNFELPLNHPCKPVV